MAAQACLPNNDVRDAFAVDYSTLGDLWEALSPDPILMPYEDDYRWLSQVYVSVQPTTGTGGLIWHALGAKTVELIHENVHVYAVRDDLDEIVLDADLLEAVLGTPDPDKKATEIEFKLAQRLRRHMGNPRYRALSERLEALKERHEAGQLHSVEFLKQLLDLAARPGGGRKGDPARGRRGPRQGRADRALRGSAQPPTRRSSSSASSPRSTRSCASCASPAGRTPAPASAKCARRCARRCSTSGCTRMRSCLRRRMGM